MEDIHCRVEPLDPTVNVLHTFSAAFGRVASYANLLKICTLASILTYEGTYRSWCPFRSAGFHAFFFSEHSTGDHSSVY
jgi:hypothetical protein